jgi:hypothetical protein
MSIKIHITDREQFRQLRSFGRGFCTYLAIGAVVPLLVLNPHISSAQSTFQVSTILCGAGLSEWIDPGGGSVTPAPCTDVVVTCGAFQGSVVSGTGVNTSFVPHRRAIANLNAELIRELSYQKKELLRQKIEILELRDKRETSICQRGSLGAVVPEVIVASTPKVVVPSPVPTKLAYKDIF